MAIDQLLFWLDSLTGAWQGMDGNGGCWDDYY